MGWGHSLRCYVVTRDTAYLNAAIAECPFQGTRQYLTDFGDDPNRIPPGAAFSASQMIRASGDHEQADLLELMNDLEMAALAEHPERIGLDNCEMAVALCRMKIDLCRRCGFRECEAEFLRILGTHAMEVGQLQDAERLLDLARQTFEQIGAEFEEACQHARVMTLANLGIVQQQLGR